MYPNSIKNLIECFKDLPGIGEKTAERMAFCLVNFDKEKLDFFANAIIDVKNNIKSCKICNNLTDQDVCSICKNTNRNKKIVFVVEKPKDIILFEKIGIFDGVYYVLEGLISPLEGINPEDIKLEGLIEKVKNDEVEELILALKPSIEGETTMQYIKKILSEYDLKISKIATGIPIGTDMEYIDSMTLELALEERKKM